MTREEVKEFLPHREPMLLIDSLEIDSDNIAHGKYHVTGEEFFLMGHFPGNPVVPGVIQCEIMAQASGLLLGDDIKGKVPLYAGINNVRFKQPVRPGDTIEITAKITNRRGPIVFVEAFAEVNGKRCEQGDLSFALIDKDKAL